MIHNHKNTSRLDQQDIQKALGKMDRVIPDMILMPNPKEGQDTVVLAELADVMKHLVGLMDQVKEVTVVMELLLSVIGRRIDCINLNF